MLRKLLKIIFKDIKPQEAMYSQRFFENLKLKDYPKYLKKIYKERTGRTLNLKNPKTLSEKIQWLKLYDNLPIKGKLSDKIEVREWVKSKTDKILFPKIYGIWDSFEKIDFESLPNTFVLKTNHASRMNIFIGDKTKIDEESSRKLNLLFTKWLNTNFAYSYGFEMQYKHIQPKIFAEEFLVNPKMDILSDYGFLCMNGKVKFIEHLVFHKEKKAERAIYNTSWQKQYFSHSEQPMLPEEIQKPQNLDLMIELAEILAEDFKLVRVDLNEIEDKIYFGEMTFTPCSGHMTYDPPEYDRILGDMLDLKITGKEKIVI